MDKIIGAITKDKDEGPSPSSLPPGNKAAGGAFPMAGSLLGLLDNDDDRSQAADHAAHRAGGSGNSDLFKSVLGSLVSSKERVSKEDIDEDDAVKKHKKYFADDDNDDEADAHGLGAAAAMQALMKFNSGDEDKGAGKSEGKFLALAMAEASKLFDDKASKNKVASGTQKDDVVKQAGEMALKMYLKSQSDSQGGFAGLASKFIK